MTGPRTPAAVRGRPLRIRLTAAFASVVAVVLAATGVLIWVQFARDFDHRTAHELGDRQATVIALDQNGIAASRLVALSGETYAQVYTPAGAVLASSRALGAERLLNEADVARAKRESFSATRSIAQGDPDDGVEAVAFALPSGRVGVIAEPRQPREDALARLALLLALTLPAALLLASVAGYQVARRALAPVDRMRTQAASIGADDPTQRLPEPGTNDELDRLAITLNELLDRSASALERERRIVGDASHELRTPISILRTRIDVALRGQGDPAQLRAALEAARHDAERLSRLADDLLVLARADQGQLPLRPEPLDVQDLLEGAAARHATEVAETGRRLVVSQDISGGAVALGDPARTEQALDNLIVNAVRHGDGLIELHSSLAGEQLLIAVRDHGRGFPPAFLPRAFERFSQAHDGAGDGEHGTGLGLAIVDALMRAQGGSAAAANAPDGGAVLTITLPLA